ncbi:hypothetical protein V22_05430 [Calycomorphotria hydatis]|uniref:Uncharacterized protein n=1 Tax=Calycomorphotria hydatis TaxID=2528027 RepID=A0A517T4L4_9PLAN|nr:hypothetical protein V22_05430 [Calycomorphotria hydatis]
MNFATRQKNTDAPVNDSMFSILLKPDINSDFEKGISNVFIKKVRTGRIHTD